MDNRIFNVNGRGVRMLMDALRIAFAQSGFDACEGYVMDPKHGMILLWHTENGITFPAKLDADTTTACVWAWLQSNPTTECVDWDADHEHDGDNVKGWRVYCEDWGHVGGNHYAICAVKPAWLWMGK